jgi:hypothetical protein
VNNTDALAILALAGLGAVQALTDPRRLMRGWYSDCCSCTRVPDAMDPNCAVHR